MPAAAIKPAAALRSPEREGLRVAISRHENAKRTAAALDDAIHAAEERVFQLGDVLAAAEEAAAKASANAARYTLNVALGSTDEPPISPKAAREAVEEAKEERESARGIRDSLTSLVDDRAQAVRWSGELLRDAIAAVVKSDPGFNSVFAKAEGLYRELVALKAVIEAPVLMGMLPREPNWWRVPIRDTSSDAEWAAALAALRVDADAELPVWK